MLSNALCFDTSGRDCVLIAFHQLDSYQTVHESSSYPLIKWNVLGCLLSVLVAYLEKGCFVFLKKVT